MQFVNNKMWLLTMVSTVGTRGRAAARVPAVFVLGLGLFAFGASTRGQEIRFQPVAASGNVISLPDPGDPADSEIVLSHGGVTVTLFVE